MVPPPKAKNEPLEIGNFVKKFMLVNCFGILDRLSQITAHKLDFCV